MFKIKRVWPLILMPPLIYPLYLLLVYRIGLAPDMELGSYEYFVAIPVTICLSIAMCLGKETNA